MRKYRLSSKAPDPRVLCVSTRDIAPVISRCLRYEFEDLIGVMDAVDVIAPADTPDPDCADTPAQNGIRTLARLAAKLFRRLSVKLEGMVALTYLRRRPSGLARNYELLFVSTQSVLDLYNLGPCAMWRSTARVSMCYIDELYAADVTGLGSLLKILKRFDHILVPLRDTVEPLASATGRPCHYLAPSTDTLQFCPYPGAPKRVIDVYAMGRSRPPETHRALLRMADAGDWYYMYDTVGNCRVSSHVEHRSRLRDMIKRSRFFLVTAARWHDIERTGGQQELGSRYFEGAAAGAVLVGDVPRNASFDEYFGWQDSVIPVPLNSGDVANVIAELDADPSRLERISNTNVVNSLRRHDHVHRWGQILSIADLKETKAMESRRRELEELAASIERAIPETR
ncbi:Glycosyl transferases group 1 [Rhodococcus tukisamuensis]|uniref:Glycosyl transferases group 1 n=2 Tax=Rhodococcus tukisamuensis TaxID=168276 RepID=A0A1G7AMN9_9NOCA|nr:Glycosyl transferases group 1 [Rhodococcus tukisamuensis]